MRMKIRVLAIFFLKKKEKKNKNKDVSLPYIASSATKNALYLHFFNKVKFQNFIVTSEFSKNKIKH